MRSVHRRFVLLPLAVVLLGSSSLVTACGDETAPDDDESEGGQGGDTASGGQGSGGAHSGGSSSGGSASDDGGAGGEGGESAGGVDFTVPEDGGSVELSLPGGGSLDFDFPASAGGLAVHLEVGSSEELGWDAGRFKTVVHMSPDGTVFDDPVVVRPSTKDLLVFSYSGGGEKEPAEGLELNAEGDGLLLDHFSSLAILPTGASCDSTSGWVPTAETAECASFGAATTRMDFTCKAYTYCLLITASCCVEPGAEACQLGDPALVLEYQANDGGNNYPYCASN